jgi:hypothetical protein
MHWRALGHVVLFPRFLQMRAVRRWTGPMARHRNRRQDSRVARLCTRSGHAVGGYLPDRVGIDRFEPGSAIIPTLSEPALRPFWSAPPGNPSLGPISPLRLARCQLPPAWTTVRLSGHAFRDPSCTCLRGENMSGWPPCHCQLYSLLPSSDPMLFARC